MMLAVIHFDEAAKLFHKLGEESLLFFTLCVCVCFFFSVFAWHAGFLSLIGQLLLLPRLRGIKEKEIKNTFFGVNYGFIIFFIRCNKLVQYQ